MFLKNTHTRFWFFQHLEIKEPPVPVLKKEKMGIGEPAGSYGYFRIIKEPPPMGKKKTNGWVEKLDFFLKIKHFENQGSDTRNQVFFLI
jgi:hypothetical protein